MAAGHRAEHTMTVIVKAMDQVDPEKLVETGKTCRTEWPLSTAGPIPYCSTYHGGAAG